MSLSQLKNQQSECNYQHLKNLFQTSEELDEPEEGVVSGKIPVHLIGSIILRVGPGKFDLGSSHDAFCVNHFLDGYAILSNFVIGETSVKFNKKYLQSEAYKRAMKAQKPVLAEFGTKAFPEKGKGLLSRFVSAIMPEMSDNNISNVFRFRNEFYVSNDACYFRQVHPETLQSGPRFDSNKLFGLNGWTAHPLTDSTGDIFNIGFSIYTGLKFFLIKIPLQTKSGDKNCSFKKYETVCTIPSSYSSGFSYVHSFGMTEKYMIFIEQPYIATLSAIAVSLLKDTPAKDWMEWRPELKNRFHVIEKSSGKLLKTHIISNEAFFFLHIVNCFQIDNNWLAVDIIAMDDPEILEGMYLSKLRNGIVDQVSQPSCRRFIVPLRPDVNDLPSLTNNFAKVTKVNNKFTITPQLLTEPGCEMPKINEEFFGKEYSYFYATGTIASNFFSHTISKVNLKNSRIDSWKGSEYMFPGEILFVPNPNAKSEDDGVLISCVSDCREICKDFIIFIDAKTMEELGRAEFSKSIPGALHGIFIPPKYVHSNL